MVSEIPTRYMTIILHYAYGYTIQFSFTFKGPQIYQLKNLNYIHNSRVNTQVEHTFCGVKKSSKNLDLSHYIIKIV